jgi:hypothetical protein
MKLCVLSKTTSFHALFTKKKERRDRNGAVLTASWVFFFPWTCKAGEEEDFSSSVTAIFPFKKMPTPFQKDVDQPYLPKRNFPHVGGAAAQWLPQPCLAPVFVGKNKGGEEKRTC